MLLMALPWAADTLTRSTSEAMAQLWSSLQRYMGLRPNARSAAFAPFADGRDAGDAAAQSDSGSASYLTEVGCRPPEQHAEQHAEHAEQRAACRATCACLQQACISTPCSRAAPCG